MQAPTFPAGLDTVFFTDGLTTFTVLPGRNECFLFFVITPIARSDNTRKRPFVAALKFRVGTRHASFNCQGRYKQLTRCHPSIVDPASGDEDTRKRMKPPFYFQDQRSHYNQNPIQGLIIITLPTTPTTTLLRQPQQAGRITT